FFVHDKVFVMFANNHHDDGHVAIWLPAPPGAQAAILSSAPAVYFKPPYVGARGWIGIELSQISDDQLALHINLAWDLMAPKRQRPSTRPARGARTRSTKKKQ
ncbi:MAG: MmcQ/YjbR family DNA-binding protein, partial [Anaerolineales bacterium]